MAALYLSSAEARLSCSSMRPRISSKRALSAASSSAFLLAMILSIISLFSSSNFLRSSSFAPSAMVIPS
ncbi:hypothetical protein AUQ37_06270 [Candidatus Methanomethylophilus sp. 1R26]|uniref:hypothetical protein n=1 Tax=Candidatus Methanomethylophilus sp. 1R26 TaxID=1769296 RepID=UPI0007360E7B|nr:hypothetical protein [Candidatus Methanomethylophilus sp. 1R26]KUE74067.1 hypothetical protein AUQ37_06270 [Candidatus Methanomethylophilus sp. 1R26]